ncbi:MAG: ATP-binding protein [Rhodoferax sp.]|jgi:nicotinamide riboside kinase|nr:ATP-binding protein [Rhodoferax sp.]
MTEPLLICLMGAECTGKTTLAKALAQHFAALWVPEYLREFCEKHDRTPAKQEQPLILQTQLERQAQVQVQARQQRLGLVFCDSSALLTAIYSDFYFADKSLHDCAHALHQGYALTLLLAADLPWLADGLQRDGRLVQAAIQALIERELVAGAHPFVRIAGGAAPRLQAAIDAVSEGAVANHAQNRCRTPSPKLLPLS